MADEKNDKAKGEGFKGLKKEDHDTLKKAAEMYTRVTGETVKGLENIPVLAEGGADPDELNKQAEEELKANAEVAKKREEAEQAERRVRGGLDDKGFPKDTGAPEPILAPMAAKQAEQVAAGARGKEPGKRERETAGGTGQTGGQKAAKVSVSG